jgi:hypothetical protein
MTKKLVFTGCSFTAGSGWDKNVTKNANTTCKDYPGLWVNLCHKNITDFSELELVNLAQNGASNNEIFQQTMESISIFGSDIHTIFCQWTSMPRYNFNAGFELWNTSESFSELYDLTHDINLNRGDSWPREYVKDLIDRIRVLHHLHWEILAVVRFTNIIDKLVKKLHIQHVYFVNGLCPWDKDYFIKLTNARPEDYTPFTKKEILNIDSRDDKDIVTLYNLAHKNYQEAGGVDQDKWINLYNSFNNNKIDTNFDNLHPGTQSNLKYYDLVKQKLTSF